MTETQAVLDLKRAIALLHGVVRQLDGQGPALRSPAAIETASAEDAPRDAVTIPVQFGGGKVYQLRAERHPREMLGGHLRGGGPVGPHAQRKENAD